MIVGIKALTIKLISQFSTVAILTALSYIISAIYNHVIGPDENSKRDMKTNINITTVVLCSARLNNPIAINTPDIKALHKNIIVLRPAKESKAIPIKVVKKLTPPTKPVTTDAFMPTFAKIVFE